LNKFYIIQALLFLTALAFSQNQAEQRNAHIKEMQFLGLGIYVAAYAVIFLPLISIVIEYSYGSWRMAMDNVLIPALISTLTVLWYIIRLFISRSDD